MMWDEIIEHLPDFPTAVITSVDNRGCPLSMRCRPWPDMEAQVVRFRLPSGTLIRLGLASLLCHKHDENLWNQKSFLVRGRITRGDEEWSFHPQQFIPGAGIGAALGVVRFVIRSRRKAKRYLQRRGLARPRIPWENIKAIKAQAKR